MFKLPCKGQVSLFACVTAVCMWSGISFGSQDWREQWFEAVRRVDLQALETHIKEGVELDVKNHQGETALMLSCAAGLTNVVDLLVANGASVAVQGKLGETSLMRAASYGSVEIVEKLISAGARVNGKDLRWLTPLAYAIHGGHKDVCEFLLKSKADPDIRPLNSPPLLVFAAQAKMRDVVGLLLEHGADVNMVDPSDSGTALMRVARAGDITFVKLFLLKGAKIDAVDTKGATALMYAVVAGKADVVALLLQNGSLVDPMERRKGFTPLMIAAEHGHADIVKLLLDAGADVNAKGTVHGSTALMLAEAKGNRDVVTLLRRFGADNSLFATDPTMVAAKQTLAELLRLDQAFEQWKLRTSASEKGVEPSLDALLRYVPQGTPLHARKGKDVLGNRFLLTPEPRISSESLDAYRPVTGDNTSTKKFWGKYHP